jgi:hypothetical protein
MEVNLIILEMQRTMSEAPLVIVNLETAIGEPLNTLAENHQRHNSKTMRKEALTKLEKSRIKSCNLYRSRKAKLLLDPVQVEAVQLDHSRMTRRDYGQRN